MKFVALDIGNVLFRVNFKTFISELSSCCNITLDHANQFLIRSQKLHDLGLVSMKEEIKEKLNVQSEINLESLIQTWNHSVQPDLSVLKFYNDMCKDEELQIALLSNIGIEHATQMESLLSHYGLFKNSINHFSCYVGARKPTSLFYQSFLISHPEFKGCLYVDDLKENLETGKKHGFQPYYFALDTMDVTAELGEIKKLLDIVPEKE